MIVRSIVATCSVLPWLVASAAAGEVPESKRALIRDLLEVSGGDLAGERVARAYLAQIRPAYPAMVEEVLSVEKNLDDGERERLRRGLSDFDRFAAAFQAAFASRVDLDEVFETVYVPLYNEHFDEDELRAILAFYRSDAGRKVVQVMPLLMQQGLEASRPLLDPRVLELVGQILAEEREQILGS